MHGLTRMPLLSFSHCLHLPAVLDTPLLCYNWTHQVLGDHRVHVTVLPLTLLCTVKQFTYRLRRAVPGVTYCPSVATLARPHLRVVPELHLLFNSGAASPETSMLLVVMERHAAQPTEGSWHVQVTAVMLKTISGVAAASRRLAQAGHCKPAQADKQQHRSNGARHSHSGWQPCCSYQCHIAAGVPTWCSDCILHASPWGVHGTHHSVDSKVDHLVSASFL